MTYLGLSNEEWFLLKWLSKEDSSAYGECKGTALDHLVELGIAEVGPMQPIYPTSRDFCRVTLTDYGWEKLQDEKMDDDRDIQLASESWS